MITALGVAIALALLVGGTIGAIAGRSNRKRAQVYGVLTEGRSRRHRGTYLYAAATSTGLQTIRPVSNPGLEKDLRLLRVCLPQTPGLYLHVLRKGIRVWRNTEDESLEYIIGIGSIAHLTDKPRKKKNHPIGFQLPKDTSGSRKTKSVGSRKNGTAGRVEGS